MKLKKVTIGLAALLVAGSFAGCVEYAPEEKTTISYLYIDTYSGGLGEEFLKELEKEFESRYAETSFADGKTGVDIVTGYTPDMLGATLNSKIKTSTHDIFISEGLYYADFMADETLYDLTEIVKAENGAIENKLYDDQKTALTAFDDKYYALPTFAGFTGLTFDANLFAENKLFFAETGGNKPATTSSYTGKAYTGRGFIEAKADQKSVGPDGKPNTLDDGLPSSYEEFFYLLDYMVDEKSITPLVFTGNSIHYSNYLFQALLSANSTKTELLSHFTFDSGEEKMKIVESFTNGVPNVKEVAIDSNTNGYEVKQQYNVYQALKFLEKLYTTKNSSGGMKYFYGDLAALSNTSAQMTYEESYLDASIQDIAMLIEGNYWYNEAMPELKESAQRLPDTATNREFSFMPLPAKEEGTVNENEGTSPALADALDYYFVVNNRIKGNTEKEKLTKEFLQFFYSDWGLQKITETNGVPMALKYEMDSAVLANMDNYPQSVWAIYKQAKDANNYVTPMSNNPIYLNNTKKFAIKSTGYFSQSVVNGITRMTPWEGFTAKSNVATAQSYFEGMKITASTWADYLG
ncbi:MAG: hypothetical protein E7357_06175 [Clostridiales bacterium]|nr:hypothetical protein [Clostridiales bacterium]